MPLYRTDGSIAAAPEWQELARKLVEGDGLMWPGDPRLSLSIGVLKDRRTGKTGRRLEVHRHNEDGSETIVSHWRPEDHFRVIYDLAGMRIDSPGHVDTVTKIEADNAALEDAQSRKAQDSMAEMLDHSLRLQHDRSNPRNKFYMNGQTDRGGRA